MPAAIYDIVIEQGATFQKTVVLKDSDGSPRDLTLVEEVRGQLRETFQSTRAFDFVLTVSNTPTDGTITWTMPATTTSQINLNPQKTFVYDVEMVFQNGTVERILQGKASLSLEVTRD